MSRNGDAATHYDAIVFGSGASGLTCATTLAKYGLRTMLAEKNPWYGGYAHGFGRDGFYWDHGGHIFLAYRLGKQAREVFHRLGLHERVEMVPDQHDYRCIFPDQSMEVPAEISAAADVMASRFPKERDGIAKVFMTMERMIDEVDLLVPSFRVQAKPGQRKLLDPVFEQFQRPWLGDLFAPVARATRFPGNTLLTWQNRTFNELLDEYLDDPLLKAYFSMLCVGIAAAPAELSAVIAGVFFVHSLRTMWMPKGGFGKLAEALATMFQEEGGTLETGAEVTRVLVENGRAVGIETRDGRTFTADAVVSACDAKRLFLELLPPEVVPGDLRRRLPGMKTTPAFFQVQLGVDMDLEPYREQIKRLNFVYPYPDIDRAMANFPNGNVEEAAYYLYVATFHQPEMAPPGKHSLKLECPTRLDSKGIDWDRDKETIADTFIRRTEAIIPDLSKHVVVKEIRTPADLARDTGNSEGAFAGWAFTPELLTRARPAQRSPVPGLYTCGHWSRPTAGVPWVMLSGFNTAGMVFADLGERSRRSYVRPAQPAPETTAPV
jgi:prolycopene isomerase